MDRQVKQTLRPHFQLVSQRLQRRHMQQISKCCADSVVCCEVLVYHKPVRQGIYRKKNYTCLGLGKSGGRASRSAELETSNSFPWLLVPRFDAFRLPGLSVVDSCRDDEGTFEASPLVFRPRLFALLSISSRILCAFCFAASHSCSVCLPLCSVTRKTLNKAHVPQI